MPRSFRLVAPRVVIAALVLCFPLAVGLSAGRFPGTKARSPAGNRLAIHEWGTFTCLQDEDGRAIAGVNTDDEAVPDFVHRISELIPRPTELAPVYYKGIPRSHRHVRMRLETPVLYFYPPAGTTAPLQASVKVGFRGGWLTEYFPNADVSAPGLQNGDLPYGRLTPETVGSLHWHDLTIGATGGQIPVTDAPVWLAPRQVRAATVRTPGGEAEKYLFYRGVGNIPSPLTVARDSDGLVVREYVEPRLKIPAAQVLRALWLVHVLEDGTVAYRPLGSAKLTGELNHVLARIPLHFEQAAAPPTAANPNDKAPRAAETLLENYSTSKLADLQRDMRQALIADGLFDDEADAMLKTWEAAYFKSPGLRLFYLLPQAWTDAVLPLECSLPADVSRTMVGRIEIVTPGQRALLKHISQMPTSTTDWFFRSIDAGGNRGEALNRLWTGNARLSEYKLAVPADYQAYVALGRFRNALILDAQSGDKTYGLHRFAEAYQIDYYTPADRITTAEGAQ